ncbi:hypothetical protein C0Q70_10204 [Pomacea canaliculata]|uniref:CUB domain-containing protein n=1 Tax=Pomacea canaliculata TaxID=400727 RepID=A0A2T7PBY6_POMCA|nr:hypothetical protein C0Q70_10204 [Pomacea canaliculata]
MNNDFLETSTQASGARGLGSTVAIVSVIRKFSERSPLHIPVTLVPAGTVSRPRWSCMKFTQPRLAANVLPSPLTTPDKGQRASRIEENSCTQSVVRVKGHQGFIQSPGYPAAVTTRRCQWNITPDTTRSAVHVFLHDLSATQRVPEPCDSGLRISAYSCDTRTQYNKLLCADEGSRQATEDVSSLLVSCGPVDIQLHSGRQQLRFWVSFKVTDNQVPEATSSVLWEAGLVVLCGDKASAGRVVPSHPEMNATVNSTATSASGVSTAGGEGDRDRTLLYVLIVLVVLFGVFTIILSGILIAVCIRRRRPRLIEHVYAVPTSCEGNSLLGEGMYRRTPSVVQVPPRPRLHEHYSDVADAVKNSPPRDVMPASPGYAEVEPRDADVNPSSSGRPRFQFRVRQRSTTPSTSSTTYEEVNPCVIATTVANNSSSGGSPSVNTKTEVTAAKRTAQAYVNAPDSADDSEEKVGGKDSNMNDKGKSKAVVTRLTTNAGPHTGLKGHNRPNQRLYPLQEGRVASLISSLNRNKDQSTKDSTKGEQKETL